MRRLLPSIACAATALVAAALPAPAAARDAHRLVTRAAPPGVVVVDRAAPAGLAQVVRTWEPTSTDVDGDGIADLLLNYHNSAEGAALYRGRGDGTYVAVARFGARDRHACTYADVDGDERRDIYCTAGAANGAGPPKKNELYLQPAGGFAGDIPFAANVADRWGIADPFGRGRHAEFFHLDHDGRPDLFLGNACCRVDGEASLNRVFRHAGSTFATIALPSAPPDPNTCVERLDYDRDGWTDVIVCAGPMRRTRLYHNVGGTLVDVSGTTYPLEVALDAAAADLNGDGRLDILSVKPTELVVHMQRADATFATRVMAITEGWRLGVGDADLDGDTDIYVQRGCGSGALPPAGGGDDAPDWFLLNDGTGRGYAVVPTPDIAQGCGDAVTPIRRFRAGRDWFVVTNGYHLSPGPVQLLAVRPLPAAAGRADRYEAASAAVSQPAAGAPAR